MCFICAQRDPSDALAGSIPHTAQRTPGSVTNEPIWKGLGLVSETVDAAESTATTYRITVGQSATGTISNSNDEDWFAIQLVAGQTYDFRMLGSGAGFLRDPFLRLMDAAGGQILAVDDQFAPELTTHQLDTAFSYTATYTGTYFLQADAYTTRTGSYLLSVTPDVAGYRPEFTVDEIAWQLINNGAASFNKPEAVGFNVGTDNRMSVNITALTSDGKALAIAALDVWSAYLGFDFVYVNTGAEITFDDEDARAFATIVTSGGFITSAEINISKAWLLDGITTADYAYETYIHEIGHALGLYHGGNYKNSAEYGIDNYYVNDSVAWSIMSYMQAEGDDNTSSWNTYVGAAFQDVYTPMIADIIAVQQLYGRSTSTFAGNTTYGFGGNTGIAALDNAATNSGGLMAMTIFDTSGTDTLNFRTTTAAQVISLASESLSSVLGGQHNLGIARGVVIENAISGSGDDLLIGNGAANRLTGGAGNDTMDGGSGRDVLTGGNGADLIRGAMGADTLSGGAGVDWLWYIGSDAGINVNLARNTATGGHAAGDVISGFEGVVGSAFADTLTGGAGADSIFGNAGSDVLTGGLGRDGFAFFSITDTDMTTNANIPDVITDFKRGQDRIDLAAIDASTVFRTDDAFLFRGKAVIGTNAAGEIRFEQVNNTGTRNDHTLIYIDTDADRAAEGVIKVMGLHNFTAGDFIL